MNAPELKIPLNKLADRAGTNLPAHRMRRLRPGEVSPLKRFNVYKQFRPVEIVPAQPKLKQEAVYQAALVHMGEVHAMDATAALESAKRCFNIIAPIVKEVV